MSTATLAQGKHLLELAAQNGLSFEGHNSLTQKGLLADLFEAAGNGNLNTVNRDEFRKILGLAPLAMEMVLDYSQTLEQMIATWHFDGWNRAVTIERFPMLGTGKVTLKPELIHFDHCMSIEDAGDTMVKRKLRPPTLAELLAFGAKYPELQRKFPIVALGQCARIGDSLCFPFLDGTDGRRWLDLGCCEEGCQKYCRFLGVRSLSSF